MNQAIQEQPGTKTTERPLYSPGLEGVIAGESALCQVDEGEAGLRYRGYAIGDLAKWSRFEEVAYLLLIGHLPTRSELDSFSTLLRGHRVLPDPVQRFIDSLQPGLHPMDVLRTGISLLGLSDPDAQDGSHEANLRKSMRLLSQIPLLIAQSRNDTIVAPSVTRKFAKAVCRRGTGIRWIDMTGDHGNSARESAQETIGWITSRFDGNPPPNDCRRI